MNPAKITKSYKLNPTEIEMPFYYNEIREPKGLLLIYIDGSQTQRKTFNFHYFVNLLLVNVMIEM